VNDESESLFWHNVETFAEGVQVQHIATFGLQTCDIDEAVPAVRDRCPDFDHVPVVNGGRIVGVLELSPEQRRSTVRACYRPLDENMLITADTSLEPSLVLLAQVPFYRLVVRESRIEGIVTRSDLLKLPVRMLAFARAVHFELVMAARIRQHFGASDAWLFSLDGEEQRRLCSLFERLAAQRAELTLLDLTSFRQKRSIAETVFEPDKPTGRALKQIEDLRNDVAHTRRFIGGRDTISGFVESIEQAKRLTAEWKGYLTPSPRPEN
jgi:CBS domain-containing protein